MAGVWRLQILIGALFFVYFGEKSSLANRHYGVSMRTNPYSELLQEKVVKQEFMRKVLAKLGMAKRPPLIPFDQRKPNIPGPVIDGGISTETSEDVEKRTQLVVASEEENRANCQDGEGCYTFKLNHSFLRKYKIHQAALHIHNEAQTSSVDSKIITINEISPNRKRRSVDDDIQVAHYNSEQQDSLRNSGAKRGFDDLSTRFFRSDLLPQWQNIDVNEVVEADKTFETKTNPDITEKVDAIISAASGSFHDRNDIKKQHRANHLNRVVFSDETNVFEGRRRKPRQILENDMGRQQVKIDWHIKRRVYVPKSDWFHISADDIVNRWLSKEQGTAVRHMLQFLAHGLNISTKPRFRPFLVLDIVEKKFQRVRKKRSYAATCVPGFNKCCLKKFYVKFKDINWHDWIIQPDGYQVNYCEGRCTGTGIMSAYSHAFIKKQLLSRRKEINLKICCIPLKFDKLPLLHYDEVGSIHKTVLEDMSVLECGCV